MDDLINRQGAIDAICNDCEYFKNEEVINAINNLPSTQQWIPCSKILPNKDGNYIVTLSYTDGFKFSFVDIDNFSVYEHQWNTYGSEVIAWMPIPEPYKTESEE